MHREMRGKSRKRNECKWNLAPAGGVSEQTTCERANNVQWSKRQWVRSIEVLFEWSDRDGEARIAQKAIWQQSMIRWHFLIACKRLDTPLGQSVGLLVSRCRICFVVYFRVVFCHATYSTVYQAFFCKKRYAHDIVSTCLHVVKNEATVCYIASVPIIIFSYYHSVCSMSVWILAYPSKKESHIRGACLGWIVFKVSHAGLSASHLITWWDESD